MEIKNNKEKGIKQGIFYGLIPHLGCIAFVIASVLGATFFTNLFKPLLLNKYFFYFLLVISFLFATLSAGIYLKKNNKLNLKGIKNKKKYLTILYSTTFFINILFFTVIFPLTTNLNAQIIKENNPNNNLDDLKLKVAIPCSGHAPLIIYELNKVGIEQIEFSMPNIFKIKYDSNKITKEQILNLSIFKNYEAKIV